METNFETVPTPEKNEKAIEALKEIIKDFGFEETEDMKANHAKILENPEEAGTYMEAWFKVGQNIADAEADPEEYKRKQAALVLANAMMYVEMGNPNGFFEQWENTREMLAQYGFADTIEEIEALME